MRTVAVAGSVPLALLLALALGVLPQAALADDLTCQVSIGFGNVAKEGAWTPVFVDITNEGESQTGEVVVPLVFRSPAARDREVGYTVSVDVPRHAKKRYVVYVPSLDLGPIRLNLTGYRGTKAVPRIKTVDPGDVVIAVIGGDPGLLGFLNGLEGLGVSAPAATGLRAAVGGGASAHPAEAVSASVGRLPWEGLPESWLGWDGADLVVLGDAGFSGASPTALQALRDWVEMGGTLVLPGGTLSPAVAASPVASLLPGRITGTTTLPDLAALSAWIGRPIEPRSVLAAQLSPASGAEVLCGSPAQPLIVSRQVGSGRVLFTTFDYTAAPVKYWDGQTQLWSRLLAYRATGVGLARRAEYAEPYGSGTLDLVRTVSTMPQAELPSLWLIVGFVLAYIIVLVPANYWVLRRLDRRELAWVTTPAVVLLFTFGAYGLGYGLRGGAVILNRINVVEAGAGATLAHGSAYLGLFSPGRTGYQIAVDAPSAGSRDLSLTDQRMPGGTRVATASQPGIADIRMNMWTTRAFSTDYQARLGRGVSGYLEYDGADLKARLRNDTGFALQNCRIVRTRTQGRAEDVAPGEEVELRYDPSHATNLPATQPFQHGPGQKPNLAEMAESSLFLNAPYLPQGTDTAPVVVARTPDLTAPARLAGQRPRTTDVNLLVLHLPIRLTRHHTMQIPEWLITTRYTASSGSIISENFDPSAQQAGDFGIDHGSMTVEYVLPLAGAPATATRLELASSGSLPTADISAYDYAHRTWEALWRGAANAPSTRPAGGGGGRMMRRGGMHAHGPAPAPPGGGTQQKMLPFPHPQDFLNPEGVVQVRVSVPSGAATVSPLVLQAAVETR